MSAVDRQEKARRHALSHDEQRADAQGQCVPCRLCGGSAEIHDAGVGFGYWIRCSNAREVAKPECTQSGTRISGWAYNVSDLWNELNRRAPVSAGKVKAIAEAAIRDCEAGAPISAANLARDVLAALQPGDGWQGIESAPKDGQTVLLHGLLHLPSIEAGTPETVMGHWTEYNGGGWVWHGSLAITFTHWMPLPAPPASLPQGEETR